MQELRPYSIQQLSKSDLPDILEIERLTLATGWSEKSFLDEFLSPSACLLGIRQVSTQRVFAFLSMRLVYDEVFIYAIAVHPQFHRNGLGTSLLQYICEMHPDCWLTLEVRASNEKAKAFYDSRGFRLIGRRSKYYQNPSEDGLVLSMFNPRSTGSRNSIAEQNTYLEKSEARLPVGVDQTKDAAEPTSALLTRLSRNG